MRDSHRTRPGLPQLAADWLIPFSSAPRLMLLVWAMSRNTLRWLIRNSHCCIRTTYFTSSPTSDSLISGTTRFITRCRACATRRLGVTETRADPKEPEFPSTVVKGRRSCPPALMLSAARAEPRARMPRTQFLDPSNDGPRSPAAVSSMRMGFLNRRKRLPEPLGGFFNTMMPPRPAS